MKHKRDEIQRCRKVEHMPANMRDVARRSSGLSISIAIVRTVRSFTGFGGMLIAEMTRQTTPNESTPARHVSRHSCGPIFCAGIS